MIAVTGASGHLGQALVRELIQRGKEVRAIITTWERAHLLEGLPVEMVVADIRDLESLISAFKGVEQVHHCAGLISIRRRQVESLKEINILGTNNVINACKINGVRRLIYTSSVEVLNSGLKGAPIAADDISAVGAHFSNTIYGQTKANATLAVIAAMGDDLETVVTLPSAIMGPYDNKPSEFGKFVLDCAWGRFHIGIDGKFDFVDSRDVAKGQAEAAEKGIPGQMYILSGTQASISEIAALVGKHFGKKLPKFNIPLAVARWGIYAAPLYCRVTGMAPICTPDALKIICGNSCFSAEKSRRHLDYNSRPIEQTIADTVKWFIDTGKIKSNNGHYLR